MDYVSDDEEYYRLQNGNGRGGGIPRVFVGSSYQRGHGIGSFLGGLFRKVLPYLGKGLRAVGKEALRAGMNVIEDVGNNTALRESVKNRFAESRGNLKRKAEEKIKNLMKGSGYKVSAKNAALQFPLGSLDTHIARRPSPRKRNRSTKRKSSSKSSAQRKSAKKSRRKKKIRASSRKTKKTTATPRRRVSEKKKRSVSDIFC